MPNNAINLLNVEELKINTETTLFQWMLYSADDLGEGVVLKGFTDNLKQLLLKSPQDGIAFVDRAVKYAFEHVKRRRLYVAASNFTTLLFESNTFELFKNTDDGSYRLAVMFALAVQNLDHFEKDEVNGYESAIRVLTGTDFKFGRNYNKHREQAFVALFGQAWTALYMEDLIGPNAVLSTLLQSRAPLVFLDNKTNNLVVPDDISPS